MGKASSPHEWGGRGWALRGLLALAAVGLVVLLAEIGMRWLADRPWYERLEEQLVHSKTPLLPVGTMRFRLRAELPGEEVHEGNAYRILFLGDSFTYGSGVENDRLVFPALATQRLQELKAPGSGRRFEFFNGGIPGSLTKRWLLLFGESADLFDPQMVVVVFFLRDGTRNLGSRKRISDIREAMGRLRRESVLVDHSRLLRFLSEKRIQQEVSRDYLESMRKAYRGDASDTEEWRNAQSNLLALRDAARERGSDFVLVIFPVLYGLKGEYPLDTVMAEIEQFAQANEISYLSLLPAFEGEDEVDLWISPTDQHPNEKGHAIAAEAMADFLAAKIAGATGELAPSGSRTAPLQSPPAGRFE